jgi:hypothetical protein
VACQGGAFPPGSRIPSGLMSSAHREASRSERPRQPDTTGADRYRTVPPRVPLHIQDPDLYSALAGHRFRLALRPPALYASTLRSIYLKHI